MGSAALSVLTVLLILLQAQAFFRIIDHKLQSQRRIVFTHKATSHWKQKLQSWEYGAYLYILEHGWSPSIRKPCWRNTFVRSEIIAEAY